MTDQEKLKAEPCCAISGKPLTPPLCIRLVVSPEGEVVPDIAENLPGKYIWVNISEVVSNPSVLPERLKKSLGTEVTIRDDMQGWIRQLLHRRMLQHLALAKKAGQLVTGNSKVREALFTGQIILLFQAEGGSQREFSKLIQGVKQPIECCRRFTATELAGILGKNHIGYLALRKGTMAETLMNDYRRYCAAMNTEQKDAL